MTRSKGFSLIETAVALAILGVVAVAAMAYWRMSAQQRTQVGELDLLARADQALVGYANAMYRLPCPDTNGDGIEDCGSNVELGQLPWRTLGLADNRARMIRYGVYRKADANAWQDTELARSLDRFRPLLAQVSCVSGSSSPTSASQCTTGTNTAGLEMALGNRNGLDFCYALDTAAAATADNAKLHTLAGDGTARNVAYAIALPGLVDADGDGKLFDGNQASQTETNPVFDAPQLPATAGDDDRVLAEGFDALFNRLACGQALAAAGHTHFNAATAAALTEQGLIDYQVQLQLAEQMAGAAVASATAGQLSAAAGLANAVASSAIAIGEAIESYGALSGLIAAAVAAIATNTAATITATATLTSAGIALDKAKANANKVGPLVDKAGSLADSIAADAKNADAAGL